MPICLSDDQRTALIVGAFEGKKNAYCPYSNFPVGAALLTTDGRIVKGASVDNASYCETICAERTAIVKAVTEGVRSFIGLAVTSNLNVPITPCGLCRQVMREFCDADMPVLLNSGAYHQPGGDEGEGVIKETTVGELLPDY